MNLQQLSFKQTAPDTAMLYLEWGNFPMRKNTYLTFAPRFAPMIGADMMFVNRPCSYYGNGDMMLSQGIFRVQTGGFCLRRVEQEHGRRSSFYMKSFTAKVNREANEVTLVFHTKPGYVSDSESYAHTFHNYLTVEQLQLIVMDMDKEEGHPVWMSNDNSQGFRFYRRYLRMWKADGGYARILRIHLSEEERKYVRLFLTGLLEDIRKGDADFTRDCEGGFECWGAYGKMHTIDINFFFEEWAYTETLHDRMTNDGNFPADGVPSYHCSPAHHYDQNPMQAVTVFHNYGDYTSMGIAQMFHETLRNYSGLAKAFLRDMQSAANRRGHTLHITLDAMPNAAWGTEDGHERSLSGDMLKPPRWYVYMKSSSGDNVYSQHFYKPYQDDNGRWSYDIHA